MVTREIAINTAKSFVLDCKMAGLTFYKVIIFGSVASDKLHEWSDVDLLLISDQFGDNVFENLKLSPLRKVGGPV
jgi:predicted nucleotidyltransferase